MPYWSSVVLPLLLPLLLISAPTEAPPAYSNLAQRLISDQYAVIRDGDGRATYVFGLPVTDARMLLLPVSRERALPEGYRPTDLVPTIGRPVRSVVVDDFRAMSAAAEVDGVDFVAVSGYRSPADQALAFEATTRRQMARAGGLITWEEAEARAARFVAPPGHSQHQLGTAIDVSSAEMNYALLPPFAETAAGRWVAQHAWEYGFVLPYPPHGEARTGYGYEPWHVRWIGRLLAGVLHADGYLYQADLVADDYLRAVEEILDREQIP